MMKKWMLTALLLGALTLITVHADTMGMGNCSSLSAMEQSFANGMTDANKEMFCSKFNKDMRNVAMDLTKQPDANGNMMTPDQAVEKIARDNQIPPVQSKPKGGCPVK